MDVHLYEVRPHAPKSSKVKLGETHEQKGDFKRVVIAEIVWTKPGRNLIILSASGNSIRPGDYSASNGGVAMAIGVA